MSIRDKAKRLDFSALPQLGEPLPAPAAELTSRPKTAPGAMMALANDQRSELLQENDRLKQQAEGSADLQKRLDDANVELRQWDGAKAGRLLDPKTIKRSRWANRHSASYLEEDFALLKREIAAAGGNVQPIKVRPVSDAPHSFEIVFGHRRHQACLELALPVLALVDNVSDADLFVEMDRENRARKDLSAWEQGVMYKRALEDGLFASKRKLAEAVGADPSALGKALALADLPDEVVGAFRSPLELQFRWAKPLADGVSADPLGMRSRASNIKMISPRPSARKVLDLLLAAGSESVEPFHTREPLVVHAHCKRAATISSTKGRVVVTFEVGAVPDSQLEALSNAINSFLSGKMRAK